MAIPALMQSTATVRKKYQKGWHLCIHIASGGVGTSIRMPLYGSPRNEYYQDLIDGVARPVEAYLEIYQNWVGEGQPAVHQEKEQMSIKYDTAADQLIFAGSASDDRRDYSTHVTISRGLIASELATARRPAAAGKSRRETCQKLSQAFIDEVLSGRASRNF